MYTTWLHPHANIMIAYGCMHYGTYNGTYHTDACIMAAYFCVHHGCILPHAAWLHIDACIMGAYCCMHHGCILMHESWLHIAAWIMVCRIAGFHQYWGNILVGGLKEGGICNKAHTCLSYPSEIGVLWEREETGNQGDWDTVDERVLQHQAVQGQSSPMGIRYDHESTESQNKKTRQTRHALVYEKSELLSCIAESWTQS